MFLSQKHLGHTFTDTAEAGGRNVSDGPRHSLGPRLMAKTAGSNCTITHPHFTEGFFRILLWFSSVYTTFSDCEKQWKVAVNRFSGAQSPPQTHRRKHFCTNTDAATETHTCHLPPSRAALLTCTRGTFLATLSSSVSSVCSVFYSFGGNFPLFLLVQTEPRAIG